MKMHFSGRGFSENLFFKNRSVEIKVTLELITIIYKVRNTNQNVRRNSKKHY